MKMVDILVLILLIGLLIGGSWFLWKNLPVGSTEYLSYAGNFTGGSQIYSNYSQFYLNMRYQDSNISYWIEPACGETKTEGIHRALSILSRNTSLRFYLGEENAEIRYLCSRTSPAPEQESHYIAGEGGPIEIINASVYSIILSGEVALYRTEKCSEPKVTLHETLHALGFNHNANPKSIMYPITSCNQEIDEYLISDINNLYMAEALPDIAIESVKANKTEGYLNFNIIVSNLGLKTAEDVRLVVYSDGSWIKEFNIGELGLGAKKSLAATGIRMPLSVSSDQIRFVLQIEEGQRELSEFNNEVKLVVA
jgi:hypothetical protein